MNGQVATRQPDPIVKLAAQLDQRAEQFRMVLPQHISPEKFQRTIITAVQQDVDLLRADRQSLVLACMKAAQDGLLPDKREAALVIFKQNYKDDQGAWHTKLMVQYMPMVYGLRKKILQSGEVQDITAKVVYRAEVEQGAFIYEEGTEAMLRHRPLLDLSEEDCTDDKIVAAYSMATYKDGTKSYEVMRRFEITKVQNCSQTGALIDRKGNSRTPSGPWVDWYPEQCKKTVMRRHSKTLPMSGDLIDVEGNELDTQRAALSAMAAMSGQAAIGAAPAEGDNGQALLEAGGSSNGAHADDIAGNGREREVIDQDTGENLDEETIARRLDAQTMNGDEPETDDEDEGEADPGEESEPLWLAKFNEIQTALLEAKTKKQVTAAKGEFMRHCVTFPDDKAQSLEKQIREALQAFDTPATA